MLDNILLVYELMAIDRPYWEFYSELGQLKLYTKIITIRVLLSLHSVASICL